MLHTWEGKSPKVSEGAWVAGSADVIGDVRLGKEVSIWFGSVLRGDINYIEIGDYSNIQDLSVCHVADEHPTIVGKNCVVGHNVVLHGCTLADNVLVGIGAILLNGSSIGEGSIVAAGTLIPEGKQYPDRSLIMGSPGKVIREVNSDNYEEIKKLAMKYVGVKNQYRAPTYFPHSPSESH